MLGIVTVQNDAERAFEAGDFDELTKLAARHADPMIQARAAELVARVGLGRAEVVFFSACTLAFVTVVAITYGAR